MLVKSRGVEHGPARAHDALARITRIGGELHHALANARTDRDVARVQCFGDKAQRLAEIEQAARTESHALLVAVSDDEDATASSKLTELEAAARRVLAESRHCAGHDVALAGLAIATRNESSSTRMRAVEKRVDALKEETRRTRARIDFAHDDVSGDVAVAGKQAPARGVPLSGDGQAIRVSATTTGPGTRVAQNQPGSGGSGPAPANPAPAPKAPAADPPSPASARPQDAMLLRTAQIALAVFEVDKSVDAVEKLATELGGHLTLRGDRQITVRVPKARFDEAVRGVEKLGDVLHRNVSTEDVTEQHVDLEMRLKNALAVRARLEKLLANATVKDAIEIHKELAKITDEVERLEGKLKVLRDRVAFSTITVVFEQTQTQSVRARALLPFPWMQTIGLGPLLSVPR